MSRINGMKLSVVSFTEGGAELGGKLVEKLANIGVSAEHDCLRGCGGKLDAWVGGRFEAGRGLVFIGAAGIAVRSVAPYIRSKASDPAVVVLDERGEFAIPLLSGHIGGANELARQLAELCGGRAVITTATDVRGVFAVDSWATGQGLAIVNPEKIKAVSSAMLDGGGIAIYSDLPIGGQPPSGVRMGGEGNPNVYISWRADAPSGALHLVASMLTAGIGCRRGVSVEAIERAFEAALDKAGTHSQAVARVCSIDIKADESGLIGFCEQRGLPFETYTARELAAVPGEFSASGFVRETVGVDNVCERAAMLGAGEGASLISGKLAVNGVTVALTAGRYRLSFDPEGMVDI